MLLPLLKPDLITTEEAAEIVARLNALEWSERQEQGRRSVIYAPTALRRLHARFLGLAEIYAAKPLVPTYTFANRYLDGGTLRMHRDRAQCEITIGIMLKGLDSLFWPLKFGSGEAISMKVGDGLLYPGPEVEHGRDPKPADGGDVIVGLLHYVDASYTGPLA